MFLFLNWFLSLTRRSPRWAKPSNIFPFGPESPFRKLEHLRSTIYHIPAQKKFSENGAPIGMKLFDWHPLGHEDAEKHWVFRLQPTVFRIFGAYCASYFCDLFLYYYRLCLLLLTYDTDPDGNLRGLSKHLFSQGKKRNSRFYAFIYMCPLHC